MYRMYKAKCIKKSAANNCKSYLADINKSVDQYNDTDHYSINNRTY